ARDLRAFCRGRQGRSVGLGAVGLALGERLAGDDRLALQAVQGLGELEVLGAAELGQRLRRRRVLGRFLFELLARFLARLVARGVFLLGALAALQVLLEVGFAGA